ncbi:MAG: AAA family ATPase [Gammaproteobacteria bacterium]|jgi:exopolysaccharide/PEP-CTERM locus tyrosine autokinase
MSVIERALDRLRKQDGSADAVVRHQGRQRTEQTIARLRQLELPAQVADDSINAAPTSFIEFDLSEFGRAGLYSGNNAQIADQYRMIKRSLLRSAVQDRDDPRAHSNLLMVASAFPGEGKTFSSVNLSLSIAKEKDWEVLLVDADCKNPTLSRLLGVDRSRGLIDMLNDPSIPLESVMLGTNIDGLSVLPLGSFDDHSAELLASSQMAEFCNRLSNPAHKRFVIFDSPPLLLTTESVILSGHVGQICIVVRANSTPQRAVVEAVEKLDQDKAIGLILNRADEIVEGRYGSYGGYGGYGSYGHPDA